jgi:hypothetical protein
MSGYLHPAYAGSLSQFGEPRILPKSGGWILKRQIPGFTDCDGIGCYPLFACQEWSRLHIDLEEIGCELVSLAVVTDPFGVYDPVYLRQCFKDVVIPFKEHFIVDLSRPMTTFVSSHHRRYARKALREVSVERCENPPQFVDEWLALYAILIERHNIRGIRAFSKSSFAKQLHVPGIVMFRARHAEVTVGIMLWYVHRDRAYYHLGAYNDTGYDSRASFALFWSAIEYFAGNGLRWLSLGAGAGIDGNGTDGLTRFKRGWSTGTLPVYFCGRILDQERYAEIVRATGSSPTDYFPAYRQGEFR